MSHCVARPPRPVAAWLCLVLLLPCAARAAVVTLTFSGLYELDQVQEFYNGGLSRGNARGPALGVSFAPAATVASDVSVGGHFLTANEPSGPVVMAFNAKRSDAAGSAVMNVPAGFSGGFSFYYSSPATGGLVTVYDGVNGSGNVLAQIQLVQTPVDASSIDPTTRLINTYSEWRIGSASFSGMARSVDFLGATDLNASVHGAAFDNVTLGSATPQLSTALDTPALMLGDGAATTKDSGHAALSRDGSVRVFQSQQTDLGADHGNVGGQDVYSVGSDGSAVLESIDSAGHKLVGSASLPAVSPDGQVVAFLFTPAGKDFATGQMFAGPRGGAKHPVDVAPGSGTPNGSAAGAPSLAQSGNGTLLAYCSAASNLVAGDTNDGRDIFVVDPLAVGAAAQRVSLDSAGHELPGDSCEPKLSGDGSKVAFSVSAPTLFGTAARQIVLKDLGASKLLLTGQMLPLTTNSNGQGAAADSSEPSVSADGSTVAFTSSADLDGHGAPVGGHEVYVSLPVGGARTLRRARSGDGTVPDGGSQHPVLSDDGGTLVLQTSASNFLRGKALADTNASPQCGAIAITTSLFAPAALGGGLCYAGGRSNANQNPTISGDGTRLVIDSNAPQPGSGSSNLNPYRQDTVDPQSVVAGLGGDFSGQWYDPTQSGQGLVIDELQPDANNNRVLLMTWFVFSNGQPTWVQGAGALRTGSGLNAGNAVVQMDQVAIFHGSGFPLGGASAKASAWGSATLTFSDANNGSLYWTSGQLGFNSGSMPLRHFLSVRTTANDSAGALPACVSGNWSEPGKSGHGFEFEVLPTSPPLLAVDWFAFAPGGAPVWIYGVGPLNGNSASFQLAIVGGSGAQFPPRFDPARVAPTAWGAFSVTFADSGHGQVSWNSTVPGYGSGQIAIQPTFAPGQLARRACR